MARTEVKPPRALANEHTLIAQRYAGYLVGHPYRQPQQTTTVKIDRRRKWKEPSVVADDCIFCVRMTDEEAVRRVVGYQYQIDIESTRTKYQYYINWLGRNAGDVPEPENVIQTPWQGLKNTNKANLRRFCELFQDTVTEKRPNGWKTRPFPFVKLPLRIKRKLCIEWNHLYLPWMEENGLQYDFENRLFWCEVPDEPALR